VSSGEIFYGCFWRIENAAQDEQAIAALRNALEADDDTDLYDMLDDLSSKHNAHVLFNGDTVTIYFGVPLTSVTEADNDFDEMALLRVMDLDNGSLKKNVREKMTKVMDAIPYSLRDRLTPPKFSIGWSS
jgi:hypothetical protein